MKEYNYPTSKEIKKAIKYMKAHPETYPINQKKKPSNKRKPKDGGHLKAAYNQVIRNLKKEFNDCKEYDDDCFQCRANRAREVLEEIVEMGFE